MLVRYIRGCAFSTVTIYKFYSVCTIIAYIVMFLACNFRIYARSISLRHGGNAMTRFYPKTFVNTI